MSLCCYLKVRYKKEAHCLRKKYLKRGNTSLNRINKTYLAKIVVIDYSFFEEISAL